MTGPRPTLGQRAAGGALVGGVWLLQHLPEAFVYRAAYGAGVLLSYVLGSRRRLLRRNLERVTTWLVANDLANDRTRAAARGGRALDSMVRAAFGHWVLTYAESARGPRYDPEAFRARVRLEPPEAVEAALAAVPPGEPGRIYVGAHFGSIELAGMYAARLGHVPVGGPMETVANPVMREYFERARSSLGVEVFPIKGSAAVMLDRLRRGLGVGVVADRVIGGSGLKAELFGATAKLPAGPALLAAESGAPMYFVTLRRAERPGRWIGRADRVLPPAEGMRRERTEALLRDHAHWIERTVALAPEQWWTLLFPVWEDIT
ncbi:MAG: lysophospholipid acyltransferase family protein [Chloroflexota bacterium]